jgi:hypothetical protein
VLEGGGAYHHQLVRSFSVTISTAETKRRGTDSYSYRDMYFEKWGFMLIFWNLAGVPLTYIHCTLYIANHDPSEYHWNPYFLTLLFVTYLFVYWIWDTANSQKNMFRAQERGVELNRKTFPQLPWKAVKNPVSIKTKTGDSILCDGWCKCFYPSCPRPHMVRHTDDLSNRRQST